ncbi:GroES-like protein [Mycena olivaceomarginata]|nr:GroES-like protein [Mycena olivaceomarginata]
MSTQQALIIPSAKAPFVLGPLPIPAPNKGEVRLKIVSVALNPLTCAQHDYDIFMPEYPAVIGSDIAGVVDEVGDGVEGFAKGDEVFAGVLFGGFQQYTTLPAAILIHKPKNLSFDEAVTFPMTFTTAVVGLFAPAPIGLALNPSYSWDKPQQGESALVIGAGTSTGQFAVQLLKFLGFTRIVVYASKVQFDYLKELGATEYIDRGEVPLEKLVVTPPVKVVYDASPVLAGALNAAYDSVVDGGKVTTVRPQAQTDRESRGITVVRCAGLYAGPDHTSFGKLMIEELPKMIEQGALVPNRVEVLPNGLASVPDALERMKAGGVSGVKLVAHPQELSA